MMPIALVLALVTAGFGHGQALLMDHQQPMKMASAEALYNTTDGAGLSLFAVAPLARHPRIRALYRQYVSRDFNPHALAPQRFSQLRAHRLPFSVEAHQRRQQP